MFPPTDTGVESSNTALYAATAIITTGDIPQLPCLLTFNPPASQGDKHQVINSYSLYDLKPVLRNASLGEAALWAVADLSVIVPDNARPGSAFVVVEPDPGTPEMPNLDAKQIRFLLTTQDNTFVPVALDYRTTHEA